MEINVPTDGDFENVDRVLQFFPNISTSCAIIGIFHDKLVEDTEMFSVNLLLQTNLTFVELGNSSFATVTIIDSDGGMQRVSKY